MSEVQSVLLNNKMLITTSASRLLMNHHFKVSKVHITNNKLRFWQANPNKDKYFRSINFEPGTDAVIGFK